MHHALGGGQRCLAGSPASAHTATLRVVHDPPAARAPRPMARLAPDTRSSLARGGRQRRCRLRRSREQSSLRLRLRPVAAAAAALLSCRTHQHEAAGCVSFISERRPGASHFTPLSAVCHVCAQRRRSWWGETCVCITQQRREARARDLATPQRESAGAVCVCELSRAFSSSAATFARNSDARPLLLSCPRTRRSSAQVAQA